MKVDMSPKAVKGRLKLVSQLWRLSISLGKAKREPNARRKADKSLSKEKTDETILLKI